MLSRLWLVALVPLSLLAGCNNTLNPLCGSARPAPLIASLSPSTVKFSDVQNNGVMLSVNGSQFVPASEIVIGGKTLAATATSASQLQVMLTTSVISGTREGWGTHGEDSLSCSNIAAVTFYFCRN